MRFLKVDVRSFLEEMMKRLSLERKEKVYEEV